MKAGGAVSKMLEGSDYILGVIGKSPKRGMRGFERCLQNN